MRLLTCMKQANDFLIAPTRPTGLAIGDGWLLSPFGSSRRPSGRLLMAELVY